MHALWSGYTTLHELLLIKLCMLGILLWSTGLLPLNLRVTCHVADGEAVLLQLGVRVHPLQDDSLLGVSLRHRLSPKSHRPQRREVSDSTAQRPWEKFDTKLPNSNKRLKSVGKSLQLCLVLCHPQGIQYWQLKFWLWPSSHNYLINIRRFGDFVC